jgi:hypothetical protein
VPHAGAGEHDDVRGVHLCHRSQLAQQQPCFVRRWFWDWEQWMMGMWRCSRC